MPERWRTGMAEQRGFDIRDADLAEQGEKRIEWARREMPVLRELAARFEKTRPLQGVRISGCLHITTETANLARTLHAGGADMLAAMQQVADEVAGEGRKAYVIPGGGSTPLGATGYVACAQEIQDQTFDLGINIDHVVCASGSAGTHAGIVTGFYGNNSNITVSGINVSRSKDEQEQLVYELVKETAVHVGIRADIPAQAVRCYDEYVGPGYSLPTAEMAAAVRMLAGLEGILMDPVYTGKAMAGCIDLIRKGIFKKGENVLFVHTGGSPALYVYMEHILAAGHKV